MSIDMRWDILGIGNPLLDVTINVDEEVLPLLELTKGSMNLISEEQSRHILKVCSHLPWELAPGGSASNTLSGASALGNRVAFFGTIGQDEYGKVYQEKIVEEGIVSHLSIEDGVATGHSIILITPDKERTMATHLGAALNFGKAHLKEEEIKNSKIIHLEAYQLETANSFEALQEALAIAKEHGVLVSLDLSDSGLIERNFNLFQQIVSEYVDIVFANEAEALAFTGEADALDALNALSELCTVAVVKIGSKGSLIKSGDEVYEIQPHKVLVVNTNGAGDTYASGILHGIAQGLDFQESGDIASRISASVVASSGARFNKSMINI